MTALYNSIAALPNVAALSRLVDRVEHRGASLPGMACFYGPSGWGKSTAAAYAANAHDCHVVQMKSAWKAGKLVRAIAAELSIKPAHTIGDIVDQIAESLARSGRTLMIDEADNAATNGMIEVIRDIYESSQVGVILIGEENLPQTLQRWERVHGRMLDWVAAKPGSAQDLDLLAPIYAPGIAIEADLKAKIMAAAGASIRRICVNLATVLERSKAVGKDRMAAADMGKMVFFTGEAPAPRKIA